MKLAYYKSCSLHATGKEYDSSLKAILKKLDIEPIEVKDWLCCGSTLAHHTSRLLAVSLPIKNLALIDKMGLDEVIVPCSACYAQFKAAQHEVAENPELKSEIEEIIEDKIGKEIKVLHPLEVLSTKDVLEKLPELVQRDLSNMKVACYYGCLLVRPPKVTKFEDECEYPMTMDNIMRAVGIPTVEWSYKTECCGGSFSTTKPEIVVKLSKRIFDDARANSADAIANPCIFCQMNLDSRERDIEKKYGEQYQIPVFYFTQLVALALGVPEKALFFNRHFVSPDKVLQKVA